MELDRESVFNSFVAGRDERAAQFGKQFVIDETTRNLCGMVLGRELGESIESFFSRNPWLAVKRDAYQHWLSRSRIEI